MAIRAAHYTETVNALKADPIVQDLAAGVAHRSDLANEDGHARWEFIQASNRQYADNLAADGRTDTGSRHLGAIAEAILGLLDEPAVPHWFQLSATEPLTIGVFRRIDVRLGVELSTQGGTYRIESIEEAASLEGHRVVLVAKID